VVGEGVERTNSGDKSDGSKKKTIFVAVDVPWCANVRGGKTVRKTKALV
jgi:hypothetical protein